MANNNEDVVRVLNQQVANWTVAFTNYTISTGT